MLVGVAGVGGARRLAAALPSWIGDCGGTSADACWECAGKVTITDCFFGRGAVVDAKVDGASTINTAVHGRRWRWS